MARSTQQDQINEINANLAALTLAVTALTALVNPAAPAKPVKAAKAKVYEAQTAEGFEFVGGYAGTGSRKLTTDNRKSFIAAHAWAKPGMSTKVLRRHAQDGATIAKGWKVAI